METAPRLLFGIIAIGSFALTADAGVILTRSALNTAIGSNGTTEQFENWSGVLFTPDGWSVLDSTTAVSGQGPGIVLPGIRYSNINSVRNLNELQLDRRSELGLTSGALLGEGGTLVVDFLSPVFFTGFDFAQFSGYSDTATVTVFGPNDTTVLFTSGLLSAPDAPASTFFGYTDGGGIGKIHLASSTRAWSPSLDNLTTAVVPEPTVACLLLGSGAIVAGWARRRSPSGLRAR